MSLPSQAQIKLAQEDNCPSVAQMRHIESCWAGHDAWDWIGIDPGQRIYNPIVEKT